MWFKVFVLSLFLFLVVVMVKLYRRLPGPFRRVWWFLALAGLGCWLLNVGGDYVIDGRADAVRGVDYQRGGQNYFKHERGAGQVLVITLGVLDDDD